MLEGHHEPCYYCGEPCNSLAASPSKWPIPLSHADEPGKVKWHHTGCVSERLIKLEKTRELLTKWELEHDYMCGRIEELQVEGESEIAINTLTSEADTLKSCINEIKTILLANPTV